MSQGRPLPHAEAYATALRLARELEPGCERIEIAGSLRRRKSEVRDIEIVAVPRWCRRSVGLLLTEEYDALEELVKDLVDVGSIVPRLVDNHRRDGTVDRQTKLGPAFKALVTGTGLPVDLFIVRPPASWGCIFALRTGPGDWNTKLVTDSQTIGRRVKGGQVEAWRGSIGRWEALPTPEEADFFAALGQAWIDPVDRRVDRVRIDRSLATAL